MKNKLIFRLFRDLFAALLIFFLLQTPLSAFELKFDAPASGIKDGNIVRACIRNDAFNEPYGNRCFPFPIQYSPATANDVIFWLQFNASDPNLKYDFDASCTSRFMVYENPQTVLNFFKSGVLQGSELSLTVSIKKIGTVYSVTCSQ